MFRSPIELRPDRNHHLGIQRMNGIDHTFRIGKTRLVKLVATPSIFRPIAPVQHNIINGNLTAAELFQGIQYLVLSLIAFAALPVAHRPLRHNLRFSCQVTITADHFVHIITVNEVIIYLVLHFPPPGLLVLFFGRHRRQCTQAAIRDISVGNPFNLQRNTLTGFQVNCKLIAVRVPGRTPTFGNHQFIINIHFRITCIIKDETELPAFHRLYLTLVSHLRTHERESLRQIHHFG